MKNIGILLPAYNEEKNIEEVIKETKKFLKEAVILVVDDGSKDRTAEIARKMDVKVIKHSRNKGKGEALKTGFDYFLKRKDVEFVLIADTDRQYSLSEALRLIKPLESKSADMVFGFRNWSKVPFRHKMGNWVWRTAFNILFGTDFKDTNCGFIALNKKALSSVKNISGGYIIENSILINALKNGIRIRQVPVTVYYRHTSKIPRGIRVEWEVLKFIIKEGFKYRFGL